MINQTDRNLPLGGRVGKTAVKKKKRRTVWIKRFLYTFSAVLLLFLIGLAWLFGTSSGHNLRYMVADTIISTQHRQWAKYIIGQKALDKRVKEYWTKFDKMAEEKSTVPIVQPPAAERKAEKRPLVEIEPISGGTFKGYLMTVSDPKAIRIVVPQKAGKGEKVSSMVKRTGAVAGVNAGGFSDPNWMGNGFKPIGLVIADGKIYYNGGGSDAPTHIVGIDKDGVMVAGKYRPSELIKMGVKEAVTFPGRFIVNGKGLIKNQADGWGVAPRTCMAQKADGTIMFAVIDGRQAHSIGATLYDVQKIFLEHGAVTAANLDGGSSSVLVHNNEIVNKPASKHGERYLPTAFLVFEHPDDVVVSNVWEGLKPQQIDAGKW